MKFLKYVIENCGSVGAYLKNDATYPVSYANLGYLHITKTQMKRICKDSCTKHYEGNVGNWCDAHRLNENVVST